MSMKMYAEMGIGNETFLSTEYESEQGETRQKGFKTNRVQSIYIRVWIAHTVIIVDSKEGIKAKAKDRRSFKLIFGIVSVA